jgi:hypothetical protein
VLFFEFSFYCFVILFEIILVTPDFGGSLSVDSKSVEQDLNFDSALGFLQELGD